MRRAFRLKAMAGFYVVGLATVVAVQWTYLYFAPRETWFTYRDIRLAAPAYVGEDIEFESFIERRRVTDMRYQDTLFCDTHDERGVRFFSQLTSEYDAAPARDAGDAARWTYTARVPHRPATCRLRSIVSAQLRFGMTKSQEIWTEEFRVERRPAPQS